MPQDPPSPPSRPVATKPVAPAKPAPTRLSEETQDELVEVCKDYMGKDIRGQLALKITKTKVAREEFTSMNLTEARAFLKDSGWFATDHNVKRFMGFLKNITGTGKFIIALWDVLEKAEEEEEK